MPQVESTSNTLGGIIESTVVTNLPVNGRDYQKLIFLVPGVTGTLSLTFLFVLFGIVDLTGPETILLGAVMTLVQCYWNQPKRTRPAQVIFNVASMAVATAAAQATYHSEWLSGRADPLQLKRLKKTKLFLRDEIARVEDQILPDIIA